MVKLVRKTIEKDFAEESCDFCGAVYTHTELRKHDDIKYHEKDYNFAIQFAKLGYAIEKQICEECFNKIEAFIESLT